ncbi:DUF7168 domain-containing protein [Pinirhizobacter sp.]|jgi:hypothetical protein|uniref:DUF7168 domain-containing protein n=1 Tax=Pinirhizobacter sp. TaxID=2950432 RepID=UPI002F423C7E
MSRDNILRKIKACLRLAASSNPNEAAAALRQAQAMMRAHGVTHAEAMDVDDAAVGTRCRGTTPPNSLCQLAYLAARGFGCRMIIDFERAGRSLRTIFRFYGTDGASEISAFAYTVLRRQLDADRTKHTARVRKRGNREARGEQFALAWVAAVERLFPEAQVPEPKRLAIDDMFKQRHPNTSVGPGRDLSMKGKAGDRDREAGFIAGTKAKLHRGVKGASTLGLEQLP